MKTLAHSLTHTSNPDMNFRDNEEKLKLTADVITVFAATVLKAKPLKSEKVEGVHCGIIQLTPTVRAVVIPVATAGELYVSYSWLREVLHLGCDAVVFVRSSDQSSYRTVTPRQVAKQCSNSTVLRVVLLEELTSCVKDEREQLVSLFGVYAEPIKAFCIPFLSLPAKHSFGPPVPWGDVWGYKAHMHAESYQRVIYPPVHVSEGVMSLLGLSSESASVHPGTSHPMHSDRMELPRRDGRRNGVSLLPTDGV